MSWRSRAGGKPVKARHRKAAVTPKRLDAPKVRGRGSIASGHETKIARLTRERDEALEREKAAAEILGIISSSPGELEPAFESELLIGGKRLKGAAHSLGNVLDAVIRQFEHQLAGFDLGQVEHVIDEFPADACR